MKNFGRRAGKRLKIIFGAGADRNHFFDAIRESKIEMAAHLGYLIRHHWEENSLGGTEINCKGRTNFFDADCQLRMKRIAWPSSISVSGWRECGNGYP